jgi:ABC-type dipeptide/oligopeptide/nickel transport system permease subunit
MTSLQTDPQTTAPGTAGTVAGEFVIRSRSQREQIIGRFIHNRRAMGALIVLGLVVLTAFVYPFFYRWKFTDQDARPGMSSRPPGTPGHLLGTEDIGKDMLALLMRGIQRSIIIALLFVLIAGAIGILVGALAGYYGRYIDNILMRFVDLLLTIPVLVVLVVVSSKLQSQGGTILSVALVIGLFGWMDLARILRSQFLSLREREFVEAAHALGASNRRIIFKHLIPNSLGQIIVWATLGAAVSVLAEASLTYLGFGVQNDTSLGVLVSDGVNAAGSRAWLFYIPGLTIMVIVMCISFIGDGVRDAFDPSHSRVRA